VSGETNEEPLSNEEMREFRKLLFGVRRSIRYHNHRCRFFDRFDKLTKILSAVFGSAAIATALNSHPAITSVLAGVIAIFSVSNLVIGAGPAARLHSELASRFATLEAKIARLGTPTAAELRNLIAERLVIESEEPPIMRVLDSFVYNELCKALGHQDRVKIGRFQSLMRQIIDIQPEKIEKQPSITADTSKPAAA
jgi:hypothetical protein